MSGNERETEAKFYVLDLRRLERRLEEAGATLIQPSAMEKNVRFDLPDGRLLSEGRVLRLRSDSQARLTYKGPSTNEGGVLSRVELEFVVEDFDKAGKLLEALGYQKLIYYEKYRSIHLLDDAQVMLDILPYGKFVEIEAGSVDAIRPVAQRLGLNWDATIGASYHALFERVRTSLHLEVEDLTFVGFSGVSVTPEALNVKAADE